MKVILATIIAVHLCAAVLAGQATAEKSSGLPLQPLAFLLGNWEAKGGSELGESEGESSFVQELDGRIIARRSLVKFTSGQAAGTKHEDLLIIYAQAPGTDLRTIFFDGEGHIIHYLVTTPSPQTAVFESDLSQAGPRYRLTHAVKGDSLETTFEIALPGQAEFKTYISGTSIRK